MPIAARPKSSLEIADATVLLVDDDPDVRGLLQDFVAAVVSTVYVAASARAALLLLKERDVDILLTDLILPDIDGFSLARRALLLRPTLRVLYISGYAETTRQSAARPRAANFLAKPCRFKDVDRALRTLVAA
ncbi:MAG: sensory box histidine kinase/response regulator hybrid [Rhodospirillales bacterium]|jgi:two-component system cell cycle sensor histidine kinase/response regulator CckA|nr:sensory box histidine kinase/response regulator hybrid [Rhodospirillales bacterium]